MENLVHLSSKIVCPILAKEISDFAKEQATVQKVEQAIYAREECLGQIENLSKAHLGDQQSEEAGTLKEHLETVSILVYNL